MLEILSSKAKHRHQCDKLHKFYWQDLYGLEPKFVQLPNYRQLVLDFLTKYTTKIIPK